MPILNFKGKSIIYSHHLSVPFCPLKVDEAKSLLLNLKDKPSLDHNLIIQGDNLYALKALMPRYAGKIDCVYIDPPYNTGNESWIFNDNVNSPLMKEWLDKEVGLDDLERHDKWLCMMWPRLCLLKELLSDDGVLICAIDHNEQEHLGLILKEIFSDKKIVCVTIVHNPRGIQGNDFSYTHEYAYFVLPYMKNIIGQKKIEKESIEWRNLRDHGGESLRSDAKNCFYPIQIKNHEIIGFGNVLKEGQHPKQQIVMEKANEVYEMWPIDQDGVERKWRYARQTVESIKHLLRVKQTKNGLEIQIGKDFATYKTTWTGSKYDSNEYGTKLLKSLIKDCSFNFPKSFYNVYDCLHAVVGHKKDAIILDSFAGSGTTAHAVLDLNKRDGGHRKFILVECESYANNITAERVRKVIKGVASSKDEKLKKGLGGIFTYCTLEEAFNEENFLKGKSLPSYDVLARYIFYTATGETLKKMTQNQHFYIGETQSKTAVFIVYKPDKNFLKSNGSALHLDRQSSVLKVMQNQNCTKAYVFAMACFVPQEELSKNNIVFCQIPFAIHKLSG